MGEKFASCTFHILYAGKYLRLGRKSLSHGTTGEADKPSVPPGNRLKANTTVRTAPL